MCVCDRPENTQLSAELHEIYYNYYCVLRGRIKGTASAVFVIQHQNCPEGGTFVPCDTFYAPTHTISYLWHGRECCMQNIPLGTGSREQ